MLLFSVVVAGRLHVFLSSSDNKVALLPLVGKSEEDSDSKAAFHVVDCDEIGINVCPVDLCVVESPARILVSVPSSLLQEVCDCSVDG